MTHQACSRTLAAGIVSREQLSLCWPEKTSIVEAEDPLRVRVFKQTKRTNRYDRKIDHPKLPLKNHQAIEQSQLQLTRAKLTYVHNKARYQKETYAGSVSYFSCPRTAAVDIDAVEHLLARAMHRESINSR